MTYLNLIHNSLFNIVYKVLSYLQVDNIVLLFITFSFCPHPCTMPLLIMLLFHLRVDVPFTKIDISFLYSIRHYYNINTKYFSTQEDIKHHFPPKYH
jgi:hypothetical protein